VSEASATASSSRAAARGGGDALALAFRHSPSPLLLVALGGRHGPTIVEASLGAARLLGRPAEELAGARLDELLDPATVELRKEVLPAAGGEPAHAVIHLDEASARASTERSLRESVSRLQDIVDNSSALIYVKDRDGRYLLVNRHFEQRFGFARDDVLGKTDFDLFPPEAARNYRLHDREVLATGRAQEVEEPAMEVDGSWLSIKFPLRDESGKPYALGGISTDITDRLRTEAAVREARDEAERANRAKSEFLSRMSHELRTPLNAILGFGQLLELEELPGEVGVSVERILKAGRHLLALINEVLEISRIEAGAHHMSVEPVCACDPLQEALELLRPLARERGIEIASDMHAGLHQYVDADFQRLKQVLLNLLTNAIKYNREDGAVRAFFRPAEPGHLRFLVTDTGPGMAEEERERIFMPFERLAAEESDTEGTGLGLALSKSLVEAMGGRIGVQHSAPGEGSTFFVELKLSSPAGGRLDQGLGQPNLSQLDDRGLGGATVLYIEDNLSNFELVERIFARMGEVHLIPAMQGVLGLELAVQHRPDLVLLDLNLPDMAGEEVLRRLKKDRRTRDVPVVVLSADATPTQVGRLRADGIVAYITKPLEIGRFIETVRLALRRPGNAQ